MNEMQKQELEHFCKRLEIGADITEIQPIGQPSQTSKPDFCIVHTQYVTGEISAKEAMLKLNLSSVGFYKRLKELELETKQEYIQSQKAAQEPVQPIQETTPPIPTFVQEWVDTPQFLEEWDTCRPSDFGFNNTYQEQSNDIEQPNIKAEEDTAYENSELEDNNLNDFGLELEDDI